MNRIKLSQITLLAFAVLTIAAGLWVAIDPFGSPDNAISSILPDPEPGDLPVDPVVVASDSSTRNPGTGEQPETNTAVAEKESSSGQAGGKFPHFGDQEVLPGVTLRDLIDADLSEEEVSDATYAIRSLSRKLTQDVYRTNPEVRDSFLTLDEAIDLSEQGFSIMKGNDPKSDGGTRYFVCPPSRTAQLDELKVAARSAYQSPRYIEHHSEKLKVGALESPRGQGELIVNVRPDGTGIDVWNAQGEPVTWQRFNIPGIASGFLPPK